MISAHFNTSTFKHLLTPKGLQELDTAFTDFLKIQDPKLTNALIKYRSDSLSLTKTQESDLLLACAPLLEKFIGQFFSIEKELDLAQEVTLAHDPIFLFKKNFVLKFAKRRLSRTEEIPDFKTLDNELMLKIGETNDKELAIAQLAQRCLQEPEKYENFIELITCWCVRALTDEKAKKMVETWVSFKIPKKIDFDHLVLKEPTNRQRDGFDLTDLRMNARQVQNEIHYCVYCHKNEGDFCSKGFPVKKNQPELGLKKNPLDVTLTGCPLDEKISEMNLLKRDGYTVAALAMIMVDNPMCPATGHRICNDCMKACIYQKQEPVNIPEAETRILTDVLALPWGVEIYDLFTRWNPLRKKQWIAKPYNGLKIMIAGMGPAGFTLAHHLLMEGFAVLGFDGLKIEALPSSLLDTPIKNFDDLTEKLSDRITQGFGGVAEYGITVRWDKNFLKLIYLTLMRRPYFQVFGSVRFGGTVTIEDAKQLGFDHLAIAVGAGLPRALPIPGSLANGMRQANDFLMALQLTGAAKSNSLANLQLRMPVLVIGGGLTGVDTATEAQAYYIKQVEKHLLRYETLVQHYGESAVRKTFDPLSLEICDEFIAHAKAIREERARAHAAGEKANFIKLLHSWGGVSIVYRRQIQDSPAYVSNHEELNKALEEGVFYRECLEPAAVELDHDKHVKALVCRHRVKTEDGNWHLSEEQTRIPAHAILVATGAKPNVAYAFEHSDTLMRNGLQYQTYELKENHLEAVPTAEHCKSPDFGPFTSYQDKNFHVSFVGDSHPVFQGNVVKAIASGLRTYPKILDALKHCAKKPGEEKEYQHFKAQMQEQFDAKLVDIQRKNRHTINLVIKAPLAAKQFKPGQFFRLQNYETRALKIGDTLLQTESLALAGASADEKSGTVTLSVLEHGASSRLCATFKKGDRLSLMGPTGVRTKIPNSPRNFLIMGGELAAIQAQAFGEAIKNTKSRLIFIGNFKSAHDVSSQKALETVCDKIIWSTQTGIPIVKNRPEDIVTSGDCLSVFAQYAKSEFDSSDLSLSKIDRITFVGNTSEVRDFKRLRHGELAKYFHPEVKIFAGVYSAMQCMLKGVCSQCLQWQIDPLTGQRTKAVYACSWQHQPLDMIDIDNIDDRLSQNQMQEQLSNLWLDYLFETQEVERL